ncbi:MAG: hypothetical protein ABH800_02055 [Candidatus Nealsonbacteria bacterium]
MAGRHENLLRGEKADIDVDDRIERAIEQLEEHVRPTTDGYNLFLKRELE